MKIWNTQNAGRSAYLLRRNKKGVPYCAHICVAKRFYSAHRTIWFMMNGPIPDGIVIDHKDGDPWNNKLSNLRLATRYQNSQNMKMKSSNKSGYKGVFYYAKNKKFGAKIRVEGKYVNLGMFITAEEADRAYKAAQAQYHGQFARYT